MAADQPCWFPGLAEALVDDAWARTPDINRRDYSTANWIGEALPAAGQTVPGAPAMALEALPGVFAAQFTSQGISPRVAAAIGEALGRLRTGGADQSVVQLIRSVHRIDAYAPGYDSSHSEPTIPFSVFVSVPLDEAHADLRLAESLLHEAMHLQLSLIEAQVALIDGSAGEHYSPWQQRARPLQGLVHGLYVFAVIAHWLGEVEAGDGLEKQDRVYITRRRREIAEEIAQVAGLPSAPGLTAIGRLLVAWLLEARPPNSPQTQASAPV